MATTTTHANPFAAWTTEAIAAYLRLSAPGVGYPKVELAWFEAENRAYALAELNRRQRTA